MHSCALFANAGSSRPALLLLLALLLSAYTARSFDPALHQHVLASRQAAAQQAAAEATAANMAAAAFAFEGSSDHTLHQTGRQLLGVPKNVLQFTGVKFETSMRAKASMVSGMATAAEHQCQRCKCCTVTLLL
jgi:hypothetical protein